MRLMNDTMIATHLGNLDRRLASVELILLQSIEPRLDRVEHILPTLATKEELRAAIADAVAPLATKAELQAAIAPLATKEELREEGERSRRHTDEVGERSRRHMDVVAESLRSDIQLIAEHVASARPKHNERS
jgi:hypothetical protein